MFTDPLLYRVAVWGNDDFGMDFDTPDRKTAYSLYLKLIHEYKYINKNDLSELGFQVF